MNFLLVCGFSKPFKYILPEDYSIIFIYSGESYPSQLDYHSKVRKIKILTEI